MVITLIGYRGTGKSTVGGQLAVRLGWECVDTDLFIEKQAGKAIARIFAEEGESFFRHLERGVLSAQLGRERVVISAGGGAILDGVTRGAMKQAGPVVWLQAPVETIVSRIAADPMTGERRPSLSGADAATEVAPLLAQREPLYAEAATMIVQTGGRTVTAVVDEIIAQLPLDEEAG